MERWKNIHRRMVLRNVTWRWQTFSR